MLSKNQAKYFKQLKQKKYRDSENLFLIEGAKMVNESLANHEEFIHSVICTAEGAQSLLKADNLNILQTDYGTLSKISSLKTPQHIIAVARKKKLGDAPVPGKDEIILALDDIKDPGNLGTIIRLADWFGVYNIVCSENSVDLYNPKVVQASMGAILRTNVFYCDLSGYLANVKNNGINIYGAMLSGKNIYETFLKKTSVIVMGNESEGISKNVASYIKHKVTIPNLSFRQTKTESLNVSIATSVILSEFRRTDFIQNES